MYENNQDRPYMQSKEACIVLDMVSALALDVSLP